MTSRTAVLAALLSSVILSAGTVLAQSVPLPVPAPKNPPKASTQRPPAIAPVPQIPQQQQEQSSGFPSIFPKPSALFGNSGTTTAFDAKQRTLADRVSAYLSGIRQLHGNFVQVGPDGGKSE